MVRKRTQGRIIEKAARGLKARAQAQHPSRSIHRGKHTQSAMNDVARKMDEVMSKGQAQNWNQSQYRDGLRTVLTEFRKDLRGGAIPLNSKHVPPVKK